jgi:cholesterol transport system auxiliary component
MTALWTTRPNHASPLTRAAWVGFAVALPLGLLGCGAAAPPSGEQPPHPDVGTYDPAWVPNRPSLPPPSTDKIDYHEDTRTLTFYTLPGNDRWMVQLPGEGQGRPVGREHRLPADVEPSEVSVYYVRPGLKPSSSVTVKQIIDSGKPHSSRVPPR